MSDFEYVYNRKENIARLKAQLEMMLWDLEDLNNDIQQVQKRIKLLEEKEGKGE